MGYADYEKSTFGDVMREGSELLIAIWGNVKKNYRGEYRDWKEIYRGLNEEDISKNLKARGRMEKFRSYLPFPTLALARREAAKDVLDKEEEEGLWAKEGLSGRLRRSF